MSGGRYARDPSYGKPPNWAALYRRHCPQDTDPWSRHARLIAKEVLRAINSPVRRMLMDEGYEPDHWASALEVTVQRLWETRAKLRALREKYEPEKLKAEEDAQMASALKRIRASS